MTPIEVQHLIKDKCDEWLNPMGYSLQTSTNLSLLYSHDNPSLYWPWPVIECKIEQENKDRIIVNLAGGGDNGLINISIKNLSFNHPDIIRFIANLRYISNCVQSMGSNSLAQYYINNLMNELKND